MMLKEEYKRMRQNEKNAQKSSYKITVRALESLIRLSEGMARAHCDYEIKPNYVREVCRLMRASNINIIRGDLEFGDIQEDINRERQLERQMAAGRNDMVRIHIQTLIKYRLLINKQINKTLMKVKRSR